jgi:hypothetical protein
LGTEVNILSLAVVYALTLTFLTQELEVVHVITQNFKKSQKESCNIDMNFSLVATFMHELFVRQLLKPAWDAL